MTVAAPEIAESYRECRVIALPGALGTAGISYPFPGVDYFRLLSFAFTVTTSGGGGARQVLAQLQDSSGADVFATAAPATQASGVTVSYVFSRDTPVFGTAALGFMGAPFLNAKLAENLTLRASVVSAGAPDLIFNARVLVERWPRVHPGPDEL